MVVDPSGAAVVEAKVNLTGPERKVETNTGHAGEFSFACLPSGSYEIRIQQEGFTAFQARVRVAGRGPRPLEVTLAVAVRRDEITVLGDNRQVNTEIGDNLDAVQLDTKALEHLPVFGNDYLGAVKQLIEASTVGAGGATLTVDGVEVSALHIPPSRIKEVRINQNPYSAEYPRPGSGRIEVITKSGGSSWHGDFEFLLRDYRLDARNAFATERPPEQYRSYDGDVSGPLSKDKKTTFIASLWREEQDQQSIVYATGLDGPIQQIVPNPVRSNAFSSAISRHISESTTASLGYDFYDRTSQGDGVGGFNTSQVAIGSDLRSHELSYNQKSVLHSKIIHDLSFRVARVGGSTSGSNPGAPKIVVLDSFTGGGADTFLHTTETRARLTDILSWSHGHHVIRIGGSSGLARQGATDRSDFVGSFYFSSLQDYQHNQPYSYVVQSGDPRLAFWQKDAGVFVQDEVRLRPNLSLAMGMRYEWQAYVPDHDNLAPRVSLAYALGKNQKTVVRAGAGIFYDRMDAGWIANMLRYNGSGIRQVTITDPGFPNPFFPGESLFTTPPNIVTFAPGLRSPYRPVYSVGIERQLSKSSAVTVNYQGSRGIDLFRSLDLNAPLPPLYVQVPDPSLGIWRQIQSSAHSEMHSLKTTFRTAVGNFFNGNVIYTWSRSYDNAGGIGVLPANNYDLAGEWARSDFDRRHRFSAFGSFNFPHNLFNMGIVFSANSGAPYNLTTGLDTNHDSFATDRPPGVPRNSLNGPGFAQLDVRWSREFPLTHARKEEVPTASVSLDAFNILNHVNYTSVVGDLSSPFFGQPVAAGWARKMQVSINLRY